MAFSKDPQKFPEMRECFITVTLPAPGMNLSEINLVLAEQTRTVTAVLEVSISSGELLCKTAHSWCICQKEASECAADTYPMGQALPCSSNTCVLSFGPFSVGPCMQELETLPHGKSKGLGICVGPLFSEAPFFADFLTWYLHLGVDRFFMYASHTEWILKWVR